MTILRTGLAALMLLLLPALAQAQGANVAFSGLQHDSTLPVEVTSDQLNVSQADGTAVFSGNVLVVQGDMRLSSDQVRVEYGAAGTENAGRIARMHASGNVVMTTPQEAAQADEAVYTIDAGSVVLTGNVILTQEQNALSGDRLVVDLNAGTGAMEGRVKTIFQPAPKE